MLFRSLDIRAFRTPNRIVMSPMTRNFCPGHVPGVDVAGYYRRRAEGGTGLIITEGVGIDHPSALGIASLDEHDVPTLHGEAAEAGWRHVVDEVHRAGGRIAPQLWHMGVMREPGSGPFPDAPSSRPSGVWGPVGRLSSMDDDYIAKMAPPTRPMTDSEIADVISAYGRSAALARRIGFDAIAIHGGHGYLLDSFLWAETNVRTDQWGGDIIGRTRAVAAVIREVRAAAGPGLPIIYRYSQWKQQDFKARLAHTPQALEALLTPLVDAGVDLFDVSTRYFAAPAFEGSKMTLAGWTRKATGALTMAVGGVCFNKGMYDTLDGHPSPAVDNLDEVAALMEQGEFDLIAVGRAILNDPDWARRARSGEPFLPFHQESLTRLT